MKKLLTLMLLAERTDKSINFIGQIERGEGKPSLESGGLSSLKRVRKKGASCPEKGIGYENFPAAGVMCL